MDSAYNSMVSQQKATVRANRAPNGRYLSDICIGPKLALEAMRNIERCGTLELDELDGAEPDQFHWKILWNMHMMPYDNKSYEKIYVYIYIYIRNPLKIAVICDDWKYIDGKCSFYLRLNI